MKFSLGEGITINNMNVSFYFDPCCPFCWITSRWLLVVEKHRDLQVTWRPFSLMLKNGDQNKTSDTAKSHKSAHRVLRVMLAARQRHGTALIDLYTSYGQAFHLDKRKFSDNVILDILKKHDLPSELLEAADDKSYDADLQAAIDEAVAVAGQDIGVPTIAFEAGDGSKNGFFGPVLQALPSLEQSLNLWDGLSKLATDKNFYELKRTRPDVKPDVASTAA
ncbi:MAG: DsbA family oxidoreductase [Candidatus Saccharimonadales bacterium]